MKKVVLFLLLFGAGLTVLVWVVGKDAPKEDVAPKEKPAPPTNFTEVPGAPTKPGEQRAAVGIVLDGRTDFTVFTSDDPEQGRPLYQVHSDDLKALGGDLYDAHELTIAVHDPETKKLRFELSSPVTQLHIPIQQGKFTIGDGEKVDFSSVRMTMHEGAPIVPLSLSTPKLTWHLVQGRLVDRIDSQDRVQFDGNGFHAEGTGFDLRREASGAALTHDGEMVLTRDGLVRLRLERGGEATLRATGSGPIRVKRVLVDPTKPDGPATLDLSTTDGSKFDVSGEEPLVLEARTLHLVGRGGSKDLADFRLERIDALEDVVATSRGDTFRARHAEFWFRENDRLERGVLDGNVVLESSGDVFHGDAATFAFDAGGRLSRTELNGSPRGTVVLGKYLAQRPNPGEIERKLQDAQAELDGVGPLVVTFGGDTTLDLAGASTLKVPALGFELLSGERLTGAVRKDRRGGTLAARGGVHARYTDAELVTDALDVRIELPAPDKEAVIVVTNGTTTVTGTPAGKGQVTLVAAGGLEARTSQGRVSIPIARRVTLKAEGPDGFDASAERVNDLDWDTKEFVAEGNVHFNGAAGDGNAERAVVHGRESVELYGTSSDPARWILARRETTKGPLSAEARALEITARDEEVHARGEVVVDFAAGQDAYHLASNALDLALDPLPAGVAPADAKERTYHAKAKGGVRANFASLGRKGELECQTLTVDGTARTREKGAEGDARLGDSDIVAEGGVRVDWKPDPLAAAAGLRGSGDKFTLDRRRHGRLESFDGRTVDARGTLGERGQPYAMRATWIDFDETHVEAANVVVGIDPEAGALPAGTPAVLELSTQHFHANEREIVLDGKAHATGRTGQGEGWEIDSGTLRITGDFQRDAKLDRKAIAWIEATGGFTATLQDRARAIGDTLRGNADTTRIEGSPARLELVARAGAVLESSWIQYDAENLLLSSDKGKLTPVGGAADSWSVTYESLQPFARGESTILVLRNPRFRQGEKEMRALWALFWVDRDEWRKRGEKVMREKAQGPELRVTVPDAPSAPNAPGKPGDDKTLADRFAMLRQHPIAQVLSEMYLEGNMELTEAGERIARAAAMYLDLKEGRGWAQDADVIQDIEIRNKMQRFRAKAQWLSIGPDLSLRADRAVLTSCEYDDPHYVIETHDLRLKPPRRAKSRSFYVSARENSLRFGDSWAMPLPPLLAGSDENGYPFIGDLNFGNTARFGTALRSSFNLPLGKVGKGIGGLFDKFLDLPTVDIPDGRWKLDAGYLGSRGVLLGTGLEYVVREPVQGDSRRGRMLFHLDSSIDGIPDRQADKGLVRVDPDDRSLLRTWFRARGRWAPTERRWWDLALSKQSDAGVQSEFFERDYLDYEQKDNYLHFRSSWDDWYFHASAKVLFEDRTDVEELPSVGLVRGRTPFGHFGELPLYYSTQNSAGYLRRRDGDSRYFTPFPDGLGSRDVLRADSIHRVEMPFELGLWNARATPFVEGRFTAWDQGVDESKAPARLAAFAGVELGTTFWKRFGNGSIHAIAPTLTLRGDLDIETTGGDPVRIDHVEDPLDGRVVELGVRSRWWKPQSEEHFDLDVRDAYATDLPSGQREGFQPVSVLSEFLTFWGSVPIGFTHDGRYDLREDETIYSRTFVGFEPAHDWGLEFGYHLGRDDGGSVLYEAATFTTRYRATQKWELEFEQSYSFSDSRGLGNTFLLRRIGHDFVMETEIGYRAGEGASFNINLKPLFAWKRSSLGLIDRWLGVYH